MKTYYLDTSLLRVVTLFVLFIVLSPIVYGEKAEKHPAVNACYELYRKGPKEDAIKTALELLSTEKSLTFADSSTLFTVLAYSFSNIGAHEQALEYAKQLATTRRIKPGAEPPRLFLPGFFIRMQQYDSAMVYFRKTEAHCINDPGNKYLLLKTWNNIGYTYYLKEQPDSALMYYTKILEDPDAQNKYTDIFGLAMGNKGNLFYVNKEYEQALEYLKIDAELTEGRIHQSHNNALYAIADCQFHLKQYPEAKHTLLRLFSSEKINDDNRLKGYKLMAALLDEMGDIHGSNRYLNKYILLSEAVSEKEKPHIELQNELIQQRVANIENEILLLDNELLLANSRERAQELGNQVYFLIVLISLLLLIGTIVYFYIFQKRKKKIHELETNLLKSDLSNKKGDLANLVRSLNYKQQFIADLKDQLKELKDTAVSDLPKEISSLHLELANYSMIDKNLEILHADIDTVNTEFYQKLESIFPSITTKEKELCGLLILNLSNKDIATLKNVSPDSIKKARQRLRKKLEIDPSEDIVEFLNRRTSLA